MWYQLFRSNTNNLHINPLWVNLWSIWGLCTIPNQSWVNTTPYRVNKSWRQHPTRHQLYAHLPPITKTIQIRRTMHTGHCSRSRDELISEVHRWTPTYSRAKAGRPAKTYIQQLCEDTGYSPEWTIGKSGERGSGISVLAARHDDDGGINDELWFVSKCLTKTITKFSIFPWISF